MRSKSFFMGRSLPMCAALAATLTFAVTGCGKTDKAGTTGASLADCSKGSSPGVTSSQIVVGNTTPLTGPLGYLGKEANAGFNVVIDQVNAGGGIDGRKIKVVSYDDQYDPSLGVPATQRLIEQDHIFAYAGGVGTPNFVAEIPLLSRAGVPAIAPFAPSTGVGTMKYPLVYMVWPTFVKEYGAVTQYLIDNEGLDKSAKVGFVHFNTSSGQDALTGTEDALAKIGNKPNKVIKVDPTYTDWASVAQAFKSAGDEWVGMQIATPSGTQLLKAMSDIDYKPKVFAMSDYVDDPTFLKDSGALADNSFWTGMKLRPLADPAAADQESQLTSALGDGVATTWTALGYTQAEILVAALKGMSDPTQQCLEKSLQSLNGVQTGFLPPVSFGPNVRQGVTAVGVAGLENGQWKAVQDFK